MANMKYFAECNGQPVVLVNVGHDGGVAARAANFSGKCLVCGGRHTATRVVEFRSFPSRHQCDDRCLNATGKVMKCECSCGGKNHGRGSAETQAAA